jgi:cellulose synthase (UDP-forming)
MPETFEGYLKQRTRWAVGCIQMLLQDNPLTKPGLTPAQRIDYFGSIFYFLFGLPRLICVLAPLSSLLFSMPPIQADAYQLILYFFSFYIASALVMRPITRGSRNPFWSDIYECAMCFTLSFQTLKALATPRKERPFEITPKGQIIKKSAPPKLSLVWPHLLTLGLLIIGLAVGLRSLQQGTGDPGLPISLLWACLNVCFLAIAIFAAREQTHGRQAFRLNHAFSGELLADGASFDARIVNINEQGAALSLTRPIFTAQDIVTLLLPSSQGPLIRLPGRIVRQQTDGAGHVSAALQFVDLDERTKLTLLDKIFGDPTPWEASYELKPGIARTLTSLLDALTVPLRSFSWERRRMLRLPSDTPCWLKTATQPFAGILRDMSFTGISVAFPSPLKEALAGSLLELPEITLKVSPVSTVHLPRETCVRFKVDSIEQGEQQWRELHDRQWRPA